MAILNYQQLSKNTLDKVFVKFDFPSVLKLATIGDSGAVSTSKISPLLVELQEALRPTLPKYEQLDHHVSQSVLAETALEDLKKSETVKDVVHRFCDINNFLALELAFNQCQFTVKGSQYTNFKDFVEKFWPIWTLLQAKAGIGSLNKVGVRKINRLLEKGNEEEALVRLGRRVEPWVLSLIQQQVVNAPKDFVFKLESKPDTDNLIRSFHIGLRRGFSEGADASLLFLDFEVYRIIEGQPVANLDEFLISKVNTLHWALFTGCLSREELTTLGAKFGHQ